MEFKINKLIGDSQSANANVGEIDKYIQTNFTCTLHRYDQYRSDTKTGSDGKERVHIKGVHESEHEWPILLEFEWGNSSEGKTKRKRMEWLRNWKL